MVAVTRAKKHAKEEILLYTDGACEHNPGRGGYAAILLWGSKELILQKAYHKTTNNRMELLAIIVGLEAIKRRDLPVKIYTDSQYVANTINKRWLNKWVATDFKKKKNPDLWLRYWKLSRQRTITVQWIRGHDGNYYNEVCDRIATQKTKKGPWERDTYYEAHHENPLLED